MSHTLALRSPATVLAHRQRMGNAQLDAGTAPVLRGLAELEHARHILKPPNNRGRTRPPQFGVEVRREVLVNDDGMRVNNISAHELLPSERFGRFCPFSAQALHTRWLWAYFDGLTRPAL